MQTESIEVTSTIYDFIKSSKDDDTTFNDMALSLFAYQFKHNAPYKKYCQKRRKTPLTVKDWRDIPAIPLQAFKALALSCEPPTEAEAIFMTSGTTNKNQRGKNHHPTLDVWDASMTTGFKQFVLPDRDRMTIYTLSPGADVNPHSSLARYLTMVVKTFGDEHSQCFFQGEALDMSGLTEALRVSEDRQKPVLLMGASFAYVHVLDYCAEKNINFELPDGSRLFDTGGFKGQSREVDQETLYASFQDTFGVSQADCINMYGMTEISSQLYDQCFVNEQGPPREKVSPAWVRTQVLHPDTLEPVEMGEVGVLAHYDLANWNSCLAVLTEDLGYQTEEGLVLLGRAKGSEARGCSLTVDALMEAHQS
ncbi:LuxE/PaaK family acyltransferase [Tuberibacillus sp. Marseille-P3662]|uniref:LuxE/PaaK family acyltransferase n=1 Tax=Tuberibacillus sp. Marseille-P3662 TaxID=1965358 RepID=UPI000A1CC625|nr:CoF synthetase [Tuberibacillus sp. Marseille-P3662]